MRTIIKSLFAMASIGICIFASSLSYAHPMHEAGAVAGLLHPLMGLDHILGMLAIGMWASQQGCRHARWLLLLSSLGLMGLATVAGIASPTVSVFEFGIAGSIVLTALLIGLRVQLGLRLGALLVSVFAAFHGFAHGLEIPAAVAPAVYLSGLLVSTALLQTVGIFLGLLLRRLKGGLPAAGVALFASGGWIIGSLILVK